MEEINHSEIITSQNDSASGWKRHTLVRKLSTNIEDVQMTMKSLHNPLMHSVHYSGVIEQQFLCR